MFLRLAYLNLFRNLRRTISTGLAVSIGFVGLNLLGAYIYRVKKSLDTTSIYTSLNGHLKLYKKNALQMYSIKPKRHVFSKEELENIERYLSSTGLVEYIGKSINGTGLLSNGTHSHPVYILGFEPETYYRSYYQADVQRWAKDWVLPNQILNSKVFLQNENAFAVTPVIADIMGLRYPLNLNEDLQLVARTLTGEMNAVNITPLAEHSTGLQFLEDSVIQVPFKKLQELLDTEGALTLAVYLNSGTNMFDFKKTLDKKMLELGIETESYFYFDENINPVYVGTLGFLIVMGAFFVFLIGTAVSLTIVNSLTMGIIERTKEIGTLYSIGFKKRHIRKLFVIENLLMCFGSIALGLVISTVCASLVNKMGFYFSPPGVSGQIQFRLEWNLTIVATVSIFILFLTWLSSFFVIQRKMNLKPVDLLQDRSS